MFPLFQGDELFFNISSNPDQQHIVPQDPFLAQYAALHGSDITNRMDKRRRRNLMSMDNNEVARDNTKNSKKKMHRDIERKRRQEMTTLYASLRALLPLEFIKGKRSISDHMNESVNYIKYLQKRIEELSAKRDGLKKFSHLSSVASPNGSSNIYSPISSVILQPCPGVIQIVLDSALRGQDFPLSRVLQVLLEEGISVVNCVSTKVNEKLFLILQTEANDPTCLNLSELRQKLTPLVVSSTSDLSK